MQVKAGGHFWILIMKRFNGLLMGLIGLLSVICVGVYALVGLELSDRSKEHDIGYEAFTPYYQFLSSAQKQVYGQAVKAALNRENSFVPLAHVDPGELSEAMHAVYFDHPEIFWLDSGFGFEYRPQDNGVVSVTMDFNSLAENLDYNSRIFNKEAQAIIAQCSRLETDREKEKAAHDELVRRVNYKEGAEHPQSAFGAIVSGESVCAGYSRAFQYIMNAMGIDTYYVSGETSDGEHAWNIVRLEGDFYNVDLTWDDIDDSYMYFNESDMVFDETHVRCASAMQLPSCMPRSTLAGKSR